MNKIEFHWRNGVRRISRRALEHGLITKQSCAICGNDKTEMHHEDYEKPLLVIWLCKKHHHELHRLKREFDGWWYAAVKCDDIVPARSWDAP